MMTKFEKEHEDALEAMQRIVDALPLEAPHPHDLAKVMFFLNTTTQNKIDEIKSLLD